VTVERFGSLAPRSGPRRVAIRAWSLGEAAAAVGLALDRHVVAALNGDQISRDQQLPLAAGDAIAFLAADVGG
jgi:molybdopterin-guanine dinucleotide biosynthesis protein A